MFVIVMCVVSVVCVYSECHVVSPAGRAEIVLTADQGVRGGKTLELKRTVDKAVEGLAFVRHVFVTKRTGGSVPHTPKDVCLEEVSLGLNML